VGSSMFLMCVERYQIYVHFGQTVPLESLRA
jgi:hypothetical protein